MNLLQKINAVLAAILLAIISVLIFGFVANADNFGWDGDEFHAPTFHAGSMFHLEPSTLVDVIFDIHQFDDIIKYQIKWDSSADMIDVSTTVPYKLTADAGLDLSSTTGITLAGNTSVVGDLTVDTDTFIVDSTLDRVAIGNAATPLTDLTIFQGANNLKGLTLSGISATSGFSSTTEGVSLLLGFVGAGNNQLWVVNKVDQGNAAKNSFRYIVGSDIPLIVGVNNNGTANKNLAFGINALGAGAAFGFPVSSLQTSVDAKIHISTGVASEVGLISQGVTSQTADLFQAKNVGDNVMFAIAADGAIKDSSGDKGTSGQIFSSTGTGTDWINEVGNIVKVGTPVNNQMAVWTGDGTLEGESEVTYDGAVLTINDSAGFSRLLISGGFVSTLDMRENDATADRRRWDFSIDNADLDFRVLTDAGVGTTYLKINRGALATVSDIAFTTPLLTTSADFQAIGAFKDSSGDVGISGQLLSSTASGTNWITEVGNVTTGVTLTNNAIIRGNGGTDVNIGSITMSGDGDDLFARMFVSNEIGAAQNAGVQVNSIEPSFALNETNVTVDNRVWGISADEETLRFEAINDTGTAFNSFMDVDRTGTTIDSVTFPMGNLTVDTTTLHVDATNNRVGLGTTTPLSKLFIDGVATTSVSGNALRFTDNFSDGVYIGLGTARNLGIFSGGLTFFGFNNNYDPVANSYQRGFALPAAVQEYNLAGDIDYKTAPTGGVGTNYTPTSKLRIMNNGLVAIGAGTALSKLHIFTEDVANIGLIVEAITSQTADMLQIKDRFGTTTAVIDKDANWGIGVTSPVGRLHVRNSGPTSVASLIVEGTGAAPILQIRNSSSVVTSTINNIDRWGVGETTPLAKLHVKSASASEVGFIIQEAPSQSGNAFEVRDNAGAIRHVITQSGKIGIGTGDPDNVMHLVTGVGDNVGVWKIENTGTNPGAIVSFVGDRDPNGNVIGSPGAIYHRANGTTSGTFEQRATASTVWFKHAVNPSNVIEIQTTAEFDDLASAGVVTIASNTTLHIKGAISTANRIVVNSGITLHITATSFGSKSLIYTGTGTFITTAGGTVRMQSGPSMISTSTGTFMSFSGAGTLTITDLGIIGWDNLGTFSDGNFNNGNITYVNCDSGWTITDPVVVNANIIIQTGTTMTDSFFTINTKKASGITFDTILALTLSSTSGLLDLSTKINNDVSLTLTNSAVITGDLFKQSTLTDATINSVADGTIGNGTITAQADNGSGGTTHSSTTTYFEDEEVAITGTTSYNGSFQIFNVVAGVSFDTITTFVANDATGTVATVRLTMTLAASHGITAGNSLKVINSQFYNGFETALNVATNDLTVNGTFIATDTGTIERQLSLDETDPRMDSRNNSGIPDSEELAFGSVNANTTATTITDGTYVAANVSTFTINQITERFRLVNATTGIWEYIDNEPLNGLLFGSLSATKTGSTEKYKFAMSTNSVVPIFATAPHVSMEVKTTEVNVALVFSVSLTKGDTIQVMVAGNGTADNLTVTDLIFGIK